MSKNAFEFTGLGLGLFNHENLQIGRCPVLRCWSRSGLTFLNSDDDELEDDELCGVDLDDLLVDDDDGFILLHAGALEKIYSFVSGRNFFK